MRNNDGIGALVSITLLVLIAIASLFWIVPQYSVWQQGMAGKASLTRAEQDRQITVLEAQAKLDSAKLLAAAEVEDAKGAAEANKIISESLGGSEFYIRWLHIKQMADMAKGGKASFIYIPTEAQLPITEAGRIAK